MDPCSFWGGLYGLPRYIGGISGLYMAYVRYWN